MISPDKQECYCNALITTLVAYPIRLCCRQLGLNKAHAPLFESSQFTPSLSTPKLKAYDEVQASNFTAPIFALRRSGHDARSQVMSNVPEALNSL